MGPAHGHCFCTDLFCNHSKKSNHSKSTDEEPIKGCFNHKQEVKCVIILAQSAFGLLSGSQAALSLLPAAGCSLQCCRELLQCKVRDGVTQWVSCRVSPVIAPLQAVQETSCVVWCEKTLHVTRVTENRVSCKIIRDSFLVWPSNSVITRCGYFEWKDKGVFTNNAGHHFYWVSSFVQSLIFWPRQY